MAKLKALSVLNDCKMVKDDLVSALKSGNQSLIRIRWINCLNFLRMVGHVLEKIDKPNFPKNQDDFDSIYRKRKSDNIYDFIVRERNLALKQYHVDIDEGPFNATEVAFWVDENDDYLVDENGDFLVIEENVTYHASKIKKTLDLWVEEAINWWSAYIEELTLRLP